MNRQQRRAGQRTRRQPPQCSVLWIPAVRGFLTRYSDGEPISSADIAMAMQLSDERAKVVALNFKKSTGLNVAIHPYRNLQ
jgi:hypothetical protein